MSRSYCPAEFWLKRFINLGFENATLMNGNAHNRRIVGGNNRHQSMQRLVCERDIVGWLGEWTEKMPRWLNVNTEMHWTCAISTIRVEYLMSCFKHKWQKHDKTFTSAGLTPDRANSGMRRTISLWVFCKEVSILLRPLLDSGESIAVKNFTPTATRTPPINWFHGKQLHFTAAESHTFPITSSSSWTCFPPRTLGLSWCDLGIAN